MNKDPNPSEVLSKGGEMASGAGLPAHVADATETDTQHSAEWHTFDTMPDIGRKFIALYNDGSGAAMYFRHHGGFIDQDGNEYDAPRWVNYDRWAYLPDLEFYCENCPEDPMTLWIAPGPAESGDAPAVAQQRASALPATDAPKPHPQKAS